MPENLIAPLHAHPGGDGRFRHLVMITLHDDADGHTREQNLDRLVEAIRRVCEEVPGIDTSFVYRNIDRGGAAEADLLLDVTYPDRDALDRVRADPRHDRMIALYRRIADLDARREVSFFEPG